MKFIYLIVHANRIMSNVINRNLNFIQPPEEAFERSLNGSPAKN